MDCNDLDALSDFMEDTQILSRRCCHHQILSPNNFACLEVSMNQDDLDAFSDFTDVLLPPTTSVYIPNAASVIS